MCVKYESNMCPLDPFLKTSFVHRSLSIHEVLVAIGFFLAGVQDETLKEESQRLAS